jgi:hypothetical protein
MSALAQPAVLRTLIRDGSAPGEQPHSRPLVRLVTFAVLGGYGVLEWGKLLTPAPTVRLLGLLGIALALVAVGPLVRRYRTQLAPVIAGVAILAALAVCGIPVRWIVHVRIAVTADWIGQGLQALPGIFIPYSGINQSVQTVVLLGAAVLLLDGALLLAFAPPVLGDLRRAGAALPLVALAMVPATLVPPALPYLEGLLLFGMLAAFVWGERVRRDDLAALVGVCVLTGAAGMFIGPRIDSHKPWINYRALSNTLRPGYVARFNWSQGYGPIARQWPRSAHTVLEVKATRPEYWKTEDLDQFNGTGWASANFTGSDLRRYVAPWAVRRWTQTVQMTLRGLDTNDVVVAGEAQLPQRLSGYVLPGASPGTFTDATSLGPGTSYRVSFYAPAPTSRQLAHAGVRYPPRLALQPYLSVSLPILSSIQEGEQQVVFALFGSLQTPQNTVDLANYPTGMAVIGQSPYRPAYDLAQTLLRGARSPYDYALRVRTYLQSGYVYDENTPLTKYPLLTFLFGTKRGYCQQFAGAMALLLRMGGVPARVADGFTYGSFNKATGNWDVTARDAHAWVEAWFPKYGWVQFDPTPAASDPALGGSARSLNIGPLGGSSVPGKGTIVPRLHGLGARGGSSGPVASGGGDSDLILVGVAAILLALLIVLIALTYAPAEPSEEALVAELERALARAGRPITDEVTLAALEERFGSSSEAAGYVRALRLARFAGHRRLPTRSQRRAVRRQLRSSLGVAGAVRALWALPPRWSIHRSG